MSLSRVRSRSDLDYYPGKRSIFIGTLVLGVVPMDNLCSIFHAVLMLCTLVSDHCKVVY